MTLPQTDYRLMSCCSAQISYRVSMPFPESHLFEIVLHIEDWRASVLDLKLPVWTPGSYLVREYARHLQDFSARSLDGSCLPWMKWRKNHWQVETENCSEVEVSYRIYANELTVRTNHLDRTHAYFNGAALFFYVPGLEKNPIRITVVPSNPDWSVTTSLPRVSDREFAFQAEDYDLLVDSPFEVGYHQLYSFEVQGKSHDEDGWT